MSIIDYGWDEYFYTEYNEKLEQGMFPARIIADYGQTLRAATDSGEILIQRPLNKNGDGMQIAVGDWLLVQYDNNAKANLICTVLKRKTKFSRAAAGIEVREQIVASNVDIVFLIQSLNRDFNMKRLERYMIAAWDSGAIPVVVLTKADLCDDVESKKAIVYETTPGVEVHAISCVTGEGIEEIRKYFTKGKTIALLGSSGVGKSTFVNLLAGEELLKTQGIREDDSKGRHTTTHRELLLLPDGGVVMDTPGMRSLLPWEADEGMEIMFGDVEEIAGSCRFHDCSHGNEPGCAVREALESGRLEERRWKSWLKLQKEMAHLEAKKEGKLRFKEKQAGRHFAKFQKELRKH
ncbi:MAG TPA: ribosome small subunit-dependent GTPase A [Pseudobacteroides sp.]|uniref:ribosome small subunit-dependent GTPase A n=1 Tax=Pseudobacteroides sp. TaxID=1968840 RepID=UPI002F95B7D8